MAKREPRQFKVIDVKRITPNLQRITLGGKGMSDFPDNSEGGYVKLNFSQADERIITRTYSIRSQRKGEIDIDFVLHNDGGPASRWAVECEKGDLIKIGGPGPKTLVDLEADWIFIVGDMTALPAISVNIENLLSHTVGNIVIEVIDEADIQSLVTPEGVKIKWIVNPKPGQNPELLIDCVRGIPTLNGQPSIWAACEFNSMRILRDYFRTERQINKDNLYISSYWKHGSNEENHRDAKRADINDIRT